MIMPNHVHAIVFDSDFNTDRLKNKLDDLRKFTGRRLLDYADTNLSDAFGQTFHENAKEDRQRKFWQSTQHPEGIFSIKFYRQKFDYIHLNSVRKGLVRSPVDWRFSSAGYWYGTNAGQETSVELLSEVRRGRPDSRHDHAPRLYPNDVELSEISWE